jgi:hypothetical protein
MTKIVVITCFGYPGSRDYSFDPEYVRADLQRVITFAINKVGCRTEKVIVLTDLSPDPQVVAEILREYQKTVRTYFRELGYRDEIPKSDRPPIEWLHDLVLKVSPRIRIAPQSLLNMVDDHIQPVIRGETVVEFASLFTNFRVISGPRDYYDQVQRQIFRAVPGDQILFYYTGHGIRFVSRGETRGFALIVLTRAGKAEYLETEKVKAIFDQLPDNVRGLVVFDCCNSSAIVSMPYEMNKKGEVSARPAIPGNRKKVVFLASCKEDQTCGFYEDKRSGRYGSLFTYYLINCLNKGKYNLRRIFRDVESAVQEYRKSHGKPAQNMSIRMTHPGIEEIPDWSLRSDASI